MTREEMVAQLTGQLCEALDEAKTEKDKLRAIKAVLFGVERYTRHSCARKINDVAREINYLDSY